MMDRYVLFPNDERIIRYVSERVKARKKPVRFTKEGEERIAWMDVSDPFDREIVVDVILLFYKAKRLIATVDPDGVRDSEYYALIGALVAVEREREKRAVETALRDRKIVHLNGFCDFVLNDLKSAWSELGTLADRLYRQCFCPSDTCALIAFFLTMTDGERRVVVIDEEAQIIEEETGEVKTIVPYSSDYEKDFIYTLMSVGPTEVLVADKELLSEEVWSCLRVFSSL